MLEDLIAKYVEWHNREHLQQEKRVKVLNVKDGGFYYEFVCLEDDIVSLKESILKNELKVSIAVIKCCFMAV